MCNETVCKASGYKECSVCGDVMKSQCTKGRCTVDKIKPLMSSPWYDVEKKLNRSESKGNKKRKRKRNIDTSETSESDDTDLSSDSQRYW